MIKCKMICENMAGDWLRTRMRCGQDGRAGKQIRPSHTLPA